MFGVISVMLRLKDLAAKGSVPVKGEVDLTGLFKDRQDVVTFGKAQVDLEAVWSDGIVEVSGSVQVPVELACSRCLQPVKELVDAPFQEWFAQQSAAIPEDKTDDVIVVSEDPLNLLPYLEETVALSLPFVIYCEEDCKGLCSQCGANLNEGECGCNRDKIDPRLAGLSDFFKQ